MSYVQRNDRNYIPNPNTTWTKTRLQRIALYLLTTFSTSNWETKIWWIVNSTKKWIIWLGLHPNSSNEMNNIPNYLLEIKKAKSFWEKKKIFLENTDQKITKEYTQKIDLLITNSSCEPIENLYKLIKIINLTNILHIKYILITNKITNLWILYLYFSKIYKYKTNIIDNVITKFGIKWLEILCKQDEYQIKKINEWILDPISFINFYMENIRI